MGRPQSSGYRADIDGMRALAVLSIVLFHIDERLVPGGFTGVDIFFVISGYLITLIISREIQAKSFTFANFYHRRILRIAPAYFVVTFLTLVAGKILLLPADLDSLARSALWSALSLPNVHFWLNIDTGYFAPASDQLPLLHLWSLGVEEQFYMLWPASLLFLSIRLNVKWKLLAVIAVVAIASFLLAQATAKAAPSFSYYMLPTRAGELLAGAMLAMVPSRTNWMPGSVAWRRALLEGEALLGYALIGYGLFALDRESIFPGWNALYPCIGTALLIHAGSGHSAALAPLRVRPVVWIGLISYSMYLWHWPILAFMRYFTTALTPLMAILSALAILVLSVLSYRFVELPFRRLRRLPAISPRTIPVIYSAAVIVLIASSAGLMLDDRIRNSDYARSYKATEYRTKAALDYRYNCQRGKFQPALFKDDRCVLGYRNHGKETHTNAILVGDSNAAHYLGVLAAIAVDQKFAFRNMTLSSCPPVFGTGDRYGDKNLLGECTRYRKALEQELRSYEYVFLGGQWTSASKRDGFRDDLARTLNQLTTHGTKVVILGQAPRFPDYNKDCELRRLRLPVVDCKARSERTGRIDSKVNKFLKAEARRHAGVYYLDVASVLCQHGKCSPYLHGRPAYFNPGHISMVGSWEIGQWLVEDGIPLQRVFASIARSQVQARGPETTEVRR